MPLTADALADQIELGFRSAWEDSMPSSIGDVGAEDRRVLFLGIARGILDYLEAQQNQILRTITLRTGATQNTTFDVTGLDLNKP